MTFNLGNSMLIHRMVKIKGQKFMLLGCKLFPFTMRTFYVSRKTLL